MNPTPEQLERLRQYGSHKELLCLECGYSGLMGIVRVEKPLLRHRWPGFVLLILVVALLDFPLIMAAVAGGLWAWLSNTNGTVATLHCPACDTLIQERKN